MKAKLNFMILLLLSFIIPAFSATFVVSNYSDEPDEDLTDNKYFPPTLRSAIENANRLGVASRIEIAEDNKTIGLTNNLPVIKFQVYFEGSGLTLEPLEAAARNGLWVEADGSTVRNVRIQNFSSTGLVWQCSDGLIELTTLRYNGVNLNMNRSHRNRIGGEIKGYFSNLIYGAKSETGGFGISLVGLFADSTEGGNNDNIIEFCGIGINEKSEPEGNRLSGIHISMSFRNIIRNNVISGNGENGIELTGSYPSTDDAGNFIWKSQALMTKIEKNVIGASQFVGDTIPNKTNGIHITSSKLDEVFSNYISGNRGNGIIVSNDICESISIYGNKIGTNKTTKIALPNSSGIQLNGKNHLIYDNVVSGNKYTGISDGSTGSYIFANIIGLDSTQEVAVPNLQGISAGNDSNIGDPFENPNIIAGNKGVGIGIGAAWIKGVVITNNIIGTNSSKTLKFPNGASGIVMTHSLRDILITGNYIADNDEHGIRIERNVVRFLDTTRPPLFQRPSKIVIEENELVGRFGKSGISVFNADSIFIHNNLIEGAVENGISIENDTTRYIFISQNDIGHPFFGLEDRKLGANGININGAKQIVIGDNDGEDYSNIIRNCKGSGILAENTDSVEIFMNLFDALDGNGITITGDSSNYLKIHTNDFGPELSTDKSRFIKGDGISIDGASDIIIGQLSEPTAQNTIHYCRGYGLSMKNNTDKVYYNMNIMKGNVKGGISLDNLDSYYNLKWYDDDLDSDEGSNGLQNTPAIVSQEVSGDSLRIKGKLKGIANETYRIDIYLSEDFPGNNRIKSQGSVFISWFTVTTNEIGEANFDTLWKSQKIIDHSATYPFVTLLTSNVGGCSGFSILEKEDSTPYVDIETEIDSLNSYVDDDGNIILKATISNKGTLNANNVIIRDTTGNYLLKDVIASKGTVSLEGDAFLVRVPMLAAGESIEYTSIGKALKTGNYKRMVWAESDEIDKNPNDNYDSLIITVLNINPFSPIAITPLNNAIGIDNPIVFKWYSVANTDAYHLQVSEGPFTTQTMKYMNEEVLNENLIIDDSTITDTTYSFRGLKGNQTQYYWHVRPIFENSSGSFWCDTLKFTSDQITWIEGLEQTNSISARIIPNPISSNGQLEVKLHKDERLRFSIMDNLGNPLQVYSSGASLSPGIYYFNLNTEGFTNGSYYLNIRSDYTNQLLKVIVIH